MEKAQPLSHFLLFLIHLRFIHQGMTATEVFVFHTRLVLTQKKLSVMKTEG